MGLGSILAFVALLVLAGPLLAAEDEISVLLERLTYGPAPGEFERVKKLGRQAFIEEQLNPEQLELPDFLRQQLDSYQTLKLDPVALFREYGPKKPESGSTPGVKELESARKNSEIILSQACQAQILRQVHSPRQLYELLVEFWLNYFNIYSGKGLSYLWVGAFERDVIRPRALGKFEDLLLATAKHPAMLAYMENWRNAVREPGKGLSEEYARELLRFHTLGPEGGYSPVDVKNLARALSGWSIGAPRSDKDSGGFSFDPKAHDSGSKTLLGQTLSAQGVEEGEQALALLAVNPRTARQVSRRLAEFLLCDAPPKELIERMAKSFQDSSGDIAKLVRVLIESPEFTDKKYQGRFKTPRRFLVSAVRASSYKVLDPLPLVQSLAGLGMPGFGCPSPEGYKLKREAWQTPEQLAKRLRLAKLIGTGKLGYQSGLAGLGTDSVPQPPDFEKLCGELKPLCTENLLTQAEKLPLAERSAFILASPGFSLY